MRLNLLLWGNSSWSRKRGEIKSRGIRGRVEYLGDKQSVLTRSLETGRQIDGLSFQLEDMTDRSNNKQAVSCAPKTSHGHKYKDLSCLRLVLTGM